MPYEKVGKNEPVCIADKIPFEIPDSWEWCRLISANNIYTGNSINATEKTLKYTNLNTGYNYIATKDVNFNCTINYNTGIKIPYDLKKFRIAPKNSILMCIEGGSFGRKISFTNQEVCFGNKLCCFVPYGINYLFLYYYLQSPLFQAKFRDNNTGIIDGVNLNTLKQMYLPIPPLPEQNRIVNLIQTLLEYVNKYDIAENDLLELNIKFPEQLKKSILNEAVQGKLVPQDPNDEPASILLEQIRKEKEQLIKEGKIKRDKHESIIFRRDNSYYEKLGSKIVCIDDEIPFEIPDSWEWCRLKQIVYNHGQIVPSDDFCYIDIGSINNKNQQSNINEKIICAKEAPSRARKIVKYGDILYATVRPYLHNMCIVNKKFSHIPIASTGFAVLACHADMYNLYLFYYLMSPIFDAYANDIENCKGMAYPAINDTRLYNALIPIPPLNEQHHIVEYILKLLQYIDDL